MRRIISVLAVVAILATACGDDIESTGPAEPAESATTSTSTTTTAATSTTTIAPTTVAPTTTAPLLGMCGELIPVVTDNGTTCVDPDAPVTTSTLSPSSDHALPPILVAGEFGLSVVAVDENGEQTSTAVPTSGRQIFDARQATDGTIFTQEYAPVSVFQGEWFVVRYDTDGTTTTLPGYGILYDVGFVEGDEVVVMRSSPITPLDDLEYGAIEARPIHDLDRVVGDFGHVPAADFNVRQADLVDGILMTVSVDGSAEFIRYTDPFGTEAAFWAPTEANVDNAAPHMAAASISTNGERLIWSEGPESIYDAETGLSEIVGEHIVIRSADIGTGDEWLYWPLVISGLDGSSWTVYSIHDLGQHIVVNLTRWVDDVMQTRVAVIDFTYEEPDNYFLDVDGLVSPALPIES